MFLPSVSLHKNKLHNGFMNENKIQATLYNQHAKKHNKTILQDNLIAFIGILKKQIHTTIVEFQKSSTFTGVTVTIGECDGPNALQFGVQSL